MKLSEARIGKTYRLMSCDTAYKTRNKLETLGLVPGELITIIQSTSAGIIAEIKHSRLAISYDLAGCLAIYDLLDE